MSKLNPATRTGLIWAGVHQLIILCGAASVFSSEYLFTLIGIGIGLVDLPIVFITIILIDAGHIHWKAPSYAMPAEPLAALRYYATAMAPFFVAGALQWFLVGYAVARRRTRRELLKQQQ